MICACINDNLDALKFLIDNGGDIELADHMGNTPIFWAVAKESLTCFHYLIPLTNLKHKDIN